MDQIVDLLDIAAKNYPIKALCDEIGKAESTLRNELTQQPGCKLGLKTSLLILKKTSDLRALDRIEAMFNRVAFELPKPDPSDLCSLMCMVADLTREFSEQMAAVAEALKDGRISPDEARKCFKESGDVIKVLIKFQAHMKQLW